MKKILYLVIGILFLGQLSFAQTTISTANGTVGYDGAGVSFGNSCVTFVVENTNSYSILLNEIELIKSNSAAGPFVYTLWSSATSLSGAPNISKPIWDSVTTTSNLNMVNGYNTIITSLNYSIAPNTKIRFAIVNQQGGINFSGNFVTNCTPSTLSANGVNLLLGDAQFSSYNIGFAGTFPTPTIEPRWFTGSITFLPNVPCTTPPIAGTAISSSLKGCINTPFELSLTGTSQATGLTYQWDSSGNGTTWFPINGATKIKLKKTQIATSYYRCKVICSGITSITNSVNVVTPPAVSGTFTINQSAPTSATNFQSFTDAINYISCGINGPIVLNVVPNSGPYNEQVAISAIGGASASNTITINGHGEELGSSNTSNANRAILTLNGADYVTIDSLTIDASQGSYGWGILLTKQADNNVIKNCTINCDGSSTSPNFLGIIINGSSQNTGVSGNNGNNNRFDRNTINGAYYSFFVFGDNSITAGNYVDNANNIISNSVLKDMYSNGIYISNCVNTLIKGNDISRPTRIASAFSVAGIGIGSNCFGTIVEKNSIHNMFDANPLSTAGFSGIISVTRTIAGKEVRVFNNIVYNINSNGVQYGISFSGDSNIAYHNSIVLDCQTSTLGATYGFYQGSLASGIVLRNNLVAITRTGTGQKRCYYFTNATSAIQCDNNSVYFNVSGGNSNFFGQWGNATFATFADWKTANAAAYDQQSVEGDQLLVSPSTGDLKPGFPNINDIGVSLGVLRDFNDSLRGASPDPGAIEFTAPPCTNPVIPGVISTVNDVCANTLFPLSITTNSIGSGQYYTWERSTSATFASGIVQVAPPSTNPNKTTSQPSNYYYRCKVKCGVSDSAYTPIQLITSPTLISGTFTINNSLPAAGTNFQTFNDAIHSISCGINGPIVFNVTSTAATYNEQLVIPAIKGTSKNNTITINGNGNTLNFVAPNFNDKVALTIKGTDHLIIDSLNIDCSGGPSGWGILLMNQADSNVIKRCNIINNNTSTSTNFIGIIINGSNLYSGTYGNNGNYNQLINNSIMGGYYGVYMTGSYTNNTQNNNNIIKGNQIFDTYNTAIYAGFQSSGLIISNNNISRPSRSNTSNFFGCYLTGNTVGALVEKNRIHNTHDILNISTAGTYAFYVNADGKVGQENKLINNQVYNINSNGAAYGIYNSGGDNMQAYHNTIILDDGATSTGWTYGIYQSSNANGIDFKNNIIYITRAGTGTKRCIVLGSTLSGIVSNNNILYLNASIGTNNAVGQYGNITFNTLNDWKAANGGAFDQVSIDVDPQFTTPTPDDNIPNNPVINGLGADVGVTTDISGNARGTNPDAGCYEVNISSCTNPPVPGVTTANIINACPGVTFTLNLNGNSIGTGQTYIWQKSPTGVAGSWFDISASPQTNPTKFVTQNATSFYRCRITCNAGVESISAPLQVNTPTSISGNFTINKNGLNTATNFKSFTDALSYITCGGMGGPVSLNVVPNSGPYKEKIYIPAILGMSATNKLTINGNGETLNFITNDANNRSAIVLDGASNVIIDSLNVDLVGGSFGWGVLLTNQADNNIVRNCIINNNIDAISTNFIGIIINGSVTSAPQPGNNGNNNLFENNKINGGYWGIYLNGNTINATQNNNNKVVNNVISDFYTYGVYAANQSNGLLISKNEISRPQRMNTGNCAGVYLSNGSTGVLVEKNIIHGMFDAQFNATSTFYGVYVGCDGKTNAPNKIINNLVYDINGNGTVYGIYNTSADTMQAYHNTLVFDDAGGATAASTFGIYQASIASGIDVRNNLVYVTRSGIGQKRCLYFSTTGSDIKSDYNVLYMNSAAGANNNLAQFGTTNYLSLSTWQTANGGVYDAHSISTNPLFVSIATANFTPTASICDSSATPLGILTDILDRPRNLTRPDIGAFEIIPVLPITLAEFTGRKNGVNNLLSWITSNELNNTGFELERSINGVEYTKIAFIQTQATNGISSQKLFYSFEDVSAPIVTKVYYRLKQIDKNGKYSYSNIVVLIGNKSDKFEITNLYPNPVISILNLAISATKEETIKILITDVVGKLIKQESRVVKKGENALPINVQNLGAGNYLIKIVCALGCENAVAKFTKE
jgi:hypothetical protein